jgi:TetR/AcrR family transcriptional regulator
MIEQEKNTEEKILEAAQIIFQKKGLQGARMQEIAELAGINKALLHYYFRTKEKLFEKILHNTIANFQPEIMKILNSDISLEDKIKEFAIKYITIAQANPYVPLFIVNQLIQNPTHITNLFHTDSFNFNQLKNQIDDEASKGNIRQISVVHLICNIFSMCAFPFVAKPMVKLIMNLNDDEYAKFLEERKKEVPEFIISALRP